jgi:uncharacterized protein YbjT (DUF2867 family)
VLGATGKTGRILVRKLLLRGYTVRVMVRDTSDSVRERLPSNVEFVAGDVGVLEDCQKAVMGMDKVSCTPPVQGPLAKPQCSHASLRIVLQVTVYTRHLFMLLILASTKTFGSKHSYSSISARA